MQDDQNPTPTPEPVIEPVEQEEPIVDEDPIEDEETSSDDTIVSGDTDSEQPVHIAVTSGEEDDEEDKNDAKEGTNKALDMLQIEDLINRQMVDIAKKRDDLKLVKSTFDDGFKNDAKFRELDDKVKETNRVKTAYKQAMMKDPALAQANSKFLNERDELKDMQMALSDYLKEYNRVTGMTQFETQDGQVLHIIQTFKLVKK